MKKSDGRFLILESLTSDTLVIPDREDDKKSLVVTGWAKVSIKDDWLSLPQFTSFHDLGLFRLYRANKLPTQPDYEVPPELKLFDKRMDDVARHIVKRPEVDQVVQALINVTPFSRSSGAGERGKIDRSWLENEGTLFLNNVLWRETKNRNRPTLKKMIGERLAAIRKGEIFYT